MVFSGGELTLIEYGSNQPLGNCRTEYMKTNLISARLNNSGPKPTKMIAYLLDLQTIYIQDLASSSTVA
jgi:intraflagellar transport protein 172